MEKSVKENLEMKLNEYVMLNNSLIEMIEKNSSYDTIKSMESIIEDTVKDIVGLKKIIENDNNNEDSNSKATRISFYDCVGKQNQEKTINIHSRKKSVENTMNEKTTLKFLKSETNGKNFNDIITNSNRFLVRFNGSLDSINEWMVKSVTFDVMDKKLQITIQDHLAERDGKKYPIISELRARIDLRTSLFGINIDYLKEDGCVLYTERFHNCHITDVWRGDLSYEKEGFNTITFTVRFDDITYETSH